MTSNSMVTTLHSSVVCFSLSSTQYLGDHQKDSQASLPEMLPSSQGHSHTQQAPNFVKSKEAYAQKSPP